MKSPLLVSLIALTAACSSLPVVGDGIVALEVQTPATLTLTLGDSIALHASALNAAGDPVNATITWQTPDTTIMVSALGVVHAIDSTGSGRVQAVVGTLHSDLITFTLTKPTTGTGSLRVR